MPLKLDAWTACPHDRPLAEVPEVLKANFGRGCYQAGKRSSPDRGDSQHRGNAGRDGIAATPDFHGRADEPALPGSGYRRATGSGRPPAAMQDVEDVGEQRGVHGLVLLQRLQQPGRAGHGERHDQPVRLGEVQGAFGGLAGRVLVAECLGRGRRGAESR